QEQGQIPPRFTPAWLQDQHIAQGPLSRRRVALFLQEDVGEEEAWFQGLRRAGDQPVQQLAGGGELLPGQAGLGPKRRRLELPCRVIYRSTDFQSVLGIGRIENPSYEKGLQVVPALLG